MFAKFRKVTYARNSFTQVTTLTGIHFLGPNYLFSTQEFRYLIKHFMAELDVFLTVHHELTIY